MNKKIINRLGSYLGIKSYSNATSIINQSAWLFIGLGFLLLPVLFIFPIPSFQFTIASTSAQLVLFGSLAGYKRNNFTTSILLIFAIWLLGSTVYHSVTNTTGGQNIILSLLLLWVALRAFLATQFISVISENSNKVEAQSEPTKFQYISRKIFAVCAWVMIIITLGYVLLAVIGSI